MSLLFTRLRIQYRQEFQGFFFRLFKRDLRFDGLGLEVLNRPGIVVPGGAGNCRHRGRQAAGPVLSPSALGGLVPCTGQGQEALGEAEDPTLQAHPAPSFSDPQ